MSLEGLDHALPVVTVAGASGKLGRQLVRSLCVEGAVVNALCRSYDDYAGSKLSESSELLLADALQPSSLVGKLAGTDTVILSVDEIAGSLEENKAAVLNILDEAKSDRSRRVRRFILLAPSRIAMLEQQRALDERCPRGSVDLMGQMEDVVNLVKTRCVAAGLAWTVIRSACTFDDLGVLALMVKKTGRVFIIDGCHRAAPIADEDLVERITRCVLLNRDLNTEVRVQGQQIVTWERAAQSACEAAGYCAPPGRDGRGCRIIHVPGWLALLLVWLSASLVNALPIARGGPLYSALHGGLSVLTLLHWRLTHDLVGGEPYGGQRSLHEFFLSIVKDS